MDVFVGNLSNRVDAGALERLFLKFCKTAHIKFFKNQNHGAKIRYACISVNPVKHAKRAIKMLNNSVFDGEMIFVREYHHRASFNERRAIGWRDIKWTTDNKRKKERRGFLTEKFNDGVHLVEMRVLDQSQAVSRAKDKKTPQPAQRASQGRRA